MPPDTISSLPAEILAEIFYQHIGFIDPHIAWESNAILCQVSRRWKSVAQSHARLWSNIYIELGYKSMSPPVEILELWLECSGGVPLHIYFSNVEPDKTTHWLGPRLLSCLTLHIHRWKHFVTSLGSRMVGLVNAIPFDKAHQLEIVSLGVYREEDSDGDDFDEESFISTLASAPDLHSLSFGSNSWGTVQNLIISFPWEGLTDVSLEIPMSMLAMLSIMHSCPSVTKMFIRNTDNFIGDDQGTYNPPSIVSLPSLRVIHLSTYAIGYDVFNHFNFPNLQVLKADISFSDAPPGGYDITPISNFCSNSQCSLRVLEVKDYMLHPGRLPTFLSDPLIAKIPVVEIFTRELPDSIQVLVNEIVRTHLEAPQVIPQYAPIGWADKAVYESLPEYFILC